MSSLKHPSELTPEDFRNAEIYNAHNDLTSKCWGFGGSVAIEPKLEYAKYQLWSQISIGFDADIKITRKTILLALENGQMSDPISNRKIGFVTKYRVVVAEISDGKVKGRILGEGSKEGGTVYETALDAYKALYEHHQNNSPSENSDQNG